MTEPKIEWTYNLGDLFDLVASAIPDRTAIIWRDQRSSFAQVAERSDRLAAALVRAGIGRGDTVGLYMRNSPVYLEALLATAKIGAISYNVNFQYVADEIAFIARDADTKGLIFDEEFESTVAEVYRQLPGIHARILVEAAGSSDSAGDALSYRKEVAKPFSRADLPPGRRGDDTLIFFTGGTTGQPKGVEWELESLFFAALGGGSFTGNDPIKSPVELRERAAKSGKLVLLICGPLMHGASIYAAFSGLFCGATLVLSDTKRFDPERIWTLVSSERVNSITLMGDAMVVPLLAAWDGDPGRWDIGSLFAIGSGGGNLSPHNIVAMKERFPKIRVVNGMGSTESGSLGGGDTNTNNDGFMLLKPRPHLAVIVDGLRYAEPGEVGIVARKGHIPLGYRGDPEKTAATFITFDGARWALTGDLARLEPDGSIRMYGRDSTTINTGGEKVFAEEVESVVKSHPDVFDVTIVGVPHPYWGQAVAAVISTVAGAGVSLEDLRAYCNGKLARYKLPQHVVLVADVKRSSAGKGDVRWAKEEAIAAIRQSESALEP